MIHSRREAVALAVISCALAALVRLLPDDAGVIRELARTLGVLAWIAPAYAVAARRGVDPLVAHGVLVRPSRAASSLGLAALTLPVYALGFVALAPRFGLPPVSHDLALLARTAATVFAWHLVFVALPEEYLFRGVLQPALGGGARGVVLASAAFALAHVVFDRDPLRAIVFFPGLAFGWLRWRTGSVVPGVAFHAACNALDLALRGAR